MTLVTDTESLAAFCERLSHADFVTVDTEFMREKTYWSQLCLVQLGGPDEAKCVDPLAPGIDLTPLYDLMANERVLKVFHAARQDLEIFLEMAQAIPHPLFDTQVAAMVCGFGESVGYETLVNKLAKTSVDKSMRFTDWSQRPLSERQVQYALADVTHLRVVYERLRRRLEREGRIGWLEEEMAVLTSPSTYRVPLEDAWRRLKPRSSSPRFLAVLRELAAWREAEAQSRNVPRQRVIRDDALLEVAAHAPASAEEMARSRLLSKGTAEGRFGQEMLAAVERGKAVPLAECPSLPERQSLSNGLAPVVDMLRLLLKMKCDAHDVAQKLVASADDLERIVADDAADVPALHGWRREVFGEDALRVKHGGLALAFSPADRRLELIPVTEED
ncbi:MAG: ribonuclease D [Alphaproteobacteria bacterium]|nr:ribonuclease D [Alphaproteobacteria bacterium]